MASRFEPRLEQLETREVPAAVNWTWNPQRGSTAGDNAGNWLKDGVRSMTAIPRTENDNVNFGTVNTECDFGPAQGTFGTITVDPTFTNTIKLGTPSTTFAGASILGACTIDLRDTACDFGNGTLGGPSGRPTVTGGGSIFVSNLDTTDLVDVLLGSSVNVNAGGTLKMGSITFTAGNTTSTFTIGGTAVSEDGGTSYFGYQLNGSYFQPIHVVAGGNLNFVSRSNIASYITVDSGAPVPGTMTVRGTQANPNVLVSITGYPSPLDQTGLNVAGVLNLAAGSTISGATIKVSGGMNLYDPPAGGATVCTISDGGLTLRGGSDSRAKLNLNNYTLSISGTLTFDYCDVTTNLNYDAGVMGNITVASGFVFFQDTNRLTQGFTGTPRGITLPLITADVLGGNGDFDQYVLETGVTPVYLASGISLRFE